MVKLNLYEEALRESEERYRNLFENASDVICTISLDGTFTSLNPAFETTTGWKCSEWVGKLFTSIIHPDDLPLAMEMIRETIRGETFPKHEWRVLSKSGESLIMEIDGGPQIHDGRVTGFFGIARDITEYKRAKEALQESKAKYSALVEQARDVVSITQDGVLKFCNKAAEEITGYTHEELVGMPFLDLMTPESRDHSEQRYQARMAGKKVPAVVEIKIRCKDGTLKDMEISTVLIQYEGRPALLGITRDITDRKQIGNQLQASEEELRLMFKSMADEITVTDLKGFITKANEQMIKMHGFSSVDELIGKSVLELVCPRHHKWVTKNMRTAMKKGSIMGIEFSVIKANGSEYPCELSASVLKDATGNPTGFIAITRDVSEQKRLKENTQFYIAEITRAQEEERKRIARELHDDIIQSLATLALETDAMNMGEEQLSDETIRQLEQLRVRIVSLMESVRNFSHELRSEILGQFGLVPALDLLTEEIREEGKIGARFLLSGSVRRLPAEAELVLFRIAQEALRNTRRHSEATEVVVNMKLTPKEVKLRITDNGRGFKLPKSLGDFASNQKLGIIGMQERARLLDGSFLIKSQVGKGTTIMVSVAQ
jgi:PAS domain S-box-containing protein